MAKGTPSYHAQPFVKGGREPLPSCVLPRIRAKVAAIAAQYGVSKSWVVATIMGDALGVDLVGYQQQPWKGKDKKAAARRKRRAA